MMAVLTKRTTVLRELATDHEEHTMYIRMIDLKHALSGFFKHRCRNRNDVCQKSGIPISQKPR